MQAVREWLGTTRTTALMALLIVTGIASLILRAAFPDESWSMGVQTAFVLLFLAGASYIVSGVLSPEARQRLYFTVIPSLAAVAIGIVIPGLFRLFLGVGFGWLIAAQFLIRSTEKQDYKQAIRAMRKSDYAKAIEHMNTLIQREPKIPEHYGFRAQLYRLNNDLHRARQDYEKVMKLDPESGLGPNGLAEISLQQNNLTEARKWGEQAYKNAPQDWVAAYNLGMIAERQGDDEVALRILIEAQNLKIPDSRHRLLTNLWLAKIYFRKGEHKMAENIVSQIKKEKQGLKEWQIILESKEAQHLRAMLQADVRMAQTLADGKSLPETFSGE